MLFIVSGILSIPSPGGDPKGGAIREGGGRGGALRHPAAAGKAADAYGKGMRFVA